MPVFDVVTFGAGTRDIFLQSKHFEEVRDALAPDGLDARIPFGGKIEIDNLFITTGGGATNSAVTFSEFGLKTACVCRVGKDDAGDAVKHALEKYKVNTQLIQTDNKLGTAHAVILLSGKGHRAILVHRSAADEIASKTVPWKTLSARWIYLTNIGARQPLLHDIFAHCKKHGASIAWNPGRAELDLGLKTLTPLLQQTAVLILNRDEAAFLCMEPPRHLHRIFDKLGRFPSRALVITDGDKGAYVRSQTKTFFADALPLEAMNTTGAGDAFGSAFVAATMRGMEVRQALQVATLNATSVVSHMGAKTGILTSMPTILSRMRVHVREIDV